MSDLENMDQYTFYREMAAQWTQFANAIKAQLDADAQQPTNIDNPDYIDSTQTPSIPQQITNPSKLSATERQELSSEEDKWRRWVGYVNSQNWSSLQDEIEASAQSHGNAIQDTNNLSAEKSYYQVTSHMDTKQSEQIDVIYEIGKCMKISSTLVPRDSDWGAGTFNNAEGFVNYKNYLLSKWKGELGNDICFENWSDTQPYVAPYSGKTLSFKDTDPLTASWNQMWEKMWSTNAEVGLRYRWAINWNPWKTTTDHWAFIYAVNTTSFLNTTSFRGFNIPDDEKSDYTKDHYDNKYNLNLVLWYLHKAKSEIRTRITNKENTHSSNPKYQNGPPLSFGTDFATMMEERKGFYESLLDIEEAKNYEYYIKNYWHARVNDAYNIESEGLELICQMQKEVVLYLRLLEKTLMDEFLIVS